MIGFLLNSLYHSKSKVILGKVHISKISCIYHRLPLSIFMISSMNFVQFLLIFFSNLFCPNTHNQIYFCVFVYLYMFIFIVHFIERSTVQPWAKTTFIPKYINSPSHLGSSPMSSYITTFFCNMIHLIPILSVLYCFVFE